MVLRGQPAQFAHHCFFSTDEHRPGLAQSGCESVCSQACLWIPPRKADPPEPSDPGKQER